jgi:hypothetical protein
VFDVISFRGAGCNSDYSMVVAKVRERLAVSKQTTNRFHIERFNLKKLNKVEGNERYRVEISIASQIWKTYAEVDTNFSQRESRLI